MEGHSTLAHLRISLCVCGGIAAYKAVEIASRLTKEGHHVHVAMTPSARQFVGALTFQAITGNPVFTDLSDPSQEGQIGHIEFAQACDLIIVAPATANVLAKAALGLGDEPVTTALLATNRPVYIAPAMNTQMWANPATVEHVRTLKERGVTIIEPESGLLACKSVGQGRLADPETIVTTVLAKQKSIDDLAGRRILITGGPTREYVDPARFISNPSSGRTGVALANAAAARGATVTLVMGPSTISRIDDRISCIQVVSAKSMYEAVMQHLKGQDIVVMSAAVADWRPAVYQTQKIKKRGRTQILELERTDDILAGLGAHPHRKQFCLVGYAAETEMVIENAREKCRAKQVDLIVANDVSDPSLGFGSADNQVHLVTLEKTHTLETAAKTQLAHQIFDYLLSEGLA